MPVDLSWMRERHQELARRAGLEAPTLEGASKPGASSRQGDVDASANNYLNLTTHPKVVEASVQATKKYGAGSDPCGRSLEQWTFTEAERVCADFKEVEASLIYSAGYTANVGLIPTLKAGGRIISDERTTGYH